MGCDPGSLGLLALALQLSAAPVSAPDAREPVDLVELAAVDHLPLGFVGRVAPRLEVRFHRVEALAMAFYAPAAPGATPPGDGRGREELEAPPSLPEERGEERWQGPADPDASGSGGTTGEGTAPPAAVAAGSSPRLFLYEPYYRRPGGELLPLLDMTPDVAEYLTHALLLAHLHLEVVEGSKSEYGSLLRSRARELYPELDEERALGAYVTALAELGSYLLSLANEIERLRSRRSDRDLCSWIEQGRFHFGAWDRAFAVEEFAGVASQPGGEAYPVRPLARRDKELFVEHVLEDRWGGARSRDFASRYCAGEAGATAPR